MTEPSAPPAVETNYPECQPDQGRPVLEPDCRIDPCSFGGGFSTTDYRIGHSVEPGAQNAYTSHHVVACHVIAQIGPGETSAPLVWQEPMTELPSTGPGDVSSLLLICAFCATMIGTLLRRLAR